MALMARSFGRIGALSGIVAMFLVWALFGLNSLRFNGLSTPDKPKGYLDLNQLWRVEIPNQVHYVHIMADPQGELQFELKHFLSVYAAYVYFKPDRIFIHTDASPDAIDRARRGLGKSDKPPNKWAKLILNLPNVKANRVKAPTVTRGGGSEIRALEHKSDFVRARVVHDLGGVYFDFDVYALRDIRPLREAGFATVLGRQLGWQVNSGCFMARARSRVMRLWIDNMDRVYNGLWTTHSNELLTHVAERLVPVPREVLILDQVALAPGSWEEADKIKLFSAHFDTPSTPPPSAKSLPSSSASAVQQNEQQQLDAEALTIFGDATGAAAEKLWPAPPPRDDAKWEIDYSASFVVHAFSPTARGEHSVENFTAITMKYLLARQSNLARLLYPIVTRAIAEGLLTEGDG
jgi:Glycosyltransferase sugar-binding region containing DXD motif